MPDRILHAAGQGKGARETTWLGVDDVDENHDRRADPTPLPRTVRADTSTPSPHGGL
jgi:hypothetical protein